MTMRPRAARLAAALGLMLGLISPVAAHGVATPAHAAGGVLRISDEGESDLAS